VGQNRAQTGSLGDDPADPWLIETIPQAGYRLIASRDPEPDPGRRGADA